MDVIDEDFGPHGQGWDFSRIYRLGGHTVRVRIHADTSYAAQSSAVAEVFTPAMTWTELIRPPYATWASDAPYHRDGSPRDLADGRAAAALGFARGLADDLAGRAATVLDTAEA